MAAAPQTAARDGVAPARARAFRGTAAPAADPVKEIARRLSAQVDELGLRMVERYREEIVDYRHADDEFLYGEVLAITVDNMRTLLASIEHDRDTTVDDLEATRTGAGRRVHQGVTLESFLHAARLWGQLLWEAVLATARIDVPEDREAALQIATRLLRHLDLMSTAAAQGYLNEVQTVWSDREVVRRDMLEALVSGKGDSERVRRLATSLKLRLADNYVVIVARGEEPPAEEEHDQPLATRVALRRIVDSARSHLRPAIGSLLVGMRQGEVVALYPVRDRAEMETVLEQCSALARLLAGDGVSFGMSGCRDGLAAIAQSYGEARDAVEIAAGTGTRGRPILFDEVLIDQLVRSSPHADRILEGTVEPLLAYDAERQVDLVPTLRAYVESGFNLTRSAELLSVHPNTVVYRLRRIKELSGRDPHDANDLLLLFLGLKLVDLSS